MRDRMIRGLEIAVGTMRVGTRTVAVIPPELAFGEAGLPGGVPADAYVVFELERLR
jgi:FKBP-type peptidyl-prolyl cis-trans isomerase